MKECPYGLVNCQFNAADFCTAPVNQQKACAIVNGDEEEQPDRYTYDDLGNGWW